MTFTSALTHEGNPRESTPFENNGLYDVGGTGAYPEPNTGLFAFTGRPGALRGTVRPAADTQIASGLVISGDFLLPKETKATFRGAVQPVFTARCALTGCHAGATPEEGLNLEDG